MENKSQIQNKTKQKEREIFLEAAHRRLNDLDLGLLLGRYLTYNYRNYHTYLQYKAILFLVRSVDVKVTRIAELKRSKFKLDKQKVKIGKKTYRLPIKVTRMIQEYFDEVPEQENAFNMNDRTWDNIRVMVSFYHSPYKSLKQTNKRELQYDHQKNRGNPRRAVTL